MIVLDISSCNYDVDPKLTDYIADKIGGLDKYLPRNARANAEGTIVLQDDPSGRQDARFVCQADIMVNGTKLFSKEGTLNMYAAVDIVEAKLKAQLRTYKDKHVNEPRRSKMLSRFRGKVGETDPATPEADTETPEVQPTA